MATVQTETPTQAQSNRKTALADSLRNHFTSNAPLTDKVRGFAKERPWASAALAGVAAIAVGNLLRGRI